MRKAYIEGINGSIEVTNSFIVVKIGSKKVYSEKELLLSFEEIEDISYKKPTRDTYGHITLYTISDNRYTLLLDKVNNKYLEDSKKLYSIINEIVANNKKVKIEEKEIENEETADLEFIEPYKEEKKSEIKEIEFKEVEIKKTTPEQVVEQSIVKPQIIKKDDVPQEISVGVSEVKTTPSTKEETKKEEKESKIILKEESAILIEDSVKEVKTEEEKTNKNLDAIGFLEQKLKDLKKELDKIYYKESILVKYIDDTKDKDEVERLIEEIEELTKALEIIKKEVKSQEKDLTSENLTLDNGKVIITSLNRDFLDNEKERLNSYIDTYKDTLNKIESIEKETESLSSNAETKKEEICISEEQYEKDVNLLYDVEKTKDFIKKYKEEAKTSLNNVRREVETSVDRFSRFRIVRRGISNQTRLLSTALAINSLRSTRNRRVNFALGIVTGISAIRDMLNFDYVEDYYSEITKKETLVGLESVDTESARYLIDDSKRQLDKILEDCEKKYSDYPDFADLRSQIMDLKNDIEKEDEELKKMEDKLQQYKGEERVKILKYREE